MSPAGDRDGLNAIERDLMDHDPALAEAFERWQAPAVEPDERPGVTTAPPWVLAVFVTAAVSWLVSPGFGVFVGLIALAWVLVGDADHHRRRPGSGARAAGDSDKAADGADGRDDGWPPPHLWRGGWI